jgi:hypothetical protein
MASLYYRGNSIWVRYRNQEGTWKSKPTGYRKTNAGERRQAERLRNTLTRRERLEAPVAGVGWEWVDAWMEGRWIRRTLRNYQICWGHLSRFLSSIDCSGPANLTREQCLAYPPWRAKTGTSINTAVHELKLLSQVMNESITRGYCEKNPASNLRLARTQPQEKQPFSDEQLSKLDAVFALGDHIYQWEGKPIRVKRFDWLHVTYLLGRYQAARISSCALPLHCVDLKHRRINYPAEIVKGGRAYSQPIDKRLLPELREIVTHRKGHATLCDLPDLSSLHWRRFLDSLDMPNISHHSLRVTWVTQAALSGIPESVAQRFSNHSSTAVHRIYQRFTTGDMAKMLDRLS